MLGAASAVRQHVGTWYSWEAFLGSVGCYLCWGEGLSSFCRGSQAVKLQKSK